MKIHRSFYIRLDQQEKLDELLPSEQKNRSKLIRFFIQNELDFSSLDFKEVESEQLTLSHLIMDEETFGLLESFVEKLKKNGVKTDRSMVMRAIVDQFIKNGVPKVSQRNRRLFLLPISDKEKLDQYIGENNRSATIEYYIWNEYDGPKGSADELKRKNGEHKQVMFYIDDYTLDQLDEYAAKLGVKRAHVFRDVVKQYLSTQEVEYANQNSEESIIKEALEELEKQNVSKEDLLNYLDSKRSN